MDLLKYKRVNLFSMIEFKNVEKIFYKDKKENKVLNNINLKIEDNDVFGIIGYSGAGKSTLIRLINALEKPTTGDVFIDGHRLADYDATQIRAVKRKIGMIFQGFNLLESKTVAENISLPLVLNGTNKKEQNKIVDELLDFVELSDKKQSYPSELSGGQKQRVSIARALANKPSILLCDEATSALDPQTTRSILDLLAKINREQKVTIVIVTHEMSVLKYICNNMLVMEAGNIVEQGFVIDIFRHPKSPVTQKFIGSVISNQLPEALMTHFTKHSIEPIFRIEFLNADEQQSIINDLIVHLQGKVKVNILFSNMINIKCDVIGYLFIQLDGGSQHIKLALDYLKTNQIKIAQLKEDGQYVWL